MLLELAEFVEVYSPGPYTKFKMFNDPTIRTFKEHNKKVKETIGKLKMAKVAKVPIIL